MRANISKLTDELWVGGDLDPRAEVAAAQLKEIHDLGIRSIIDVRSEWSDELFVKDMYPEMAYTHLGTDDDGEDKAGEWFNEVRDAAEALMDLGYKTLIHCHMGVNRAPSAAGYVLVNRHGMTGVEAWKLIRRKRPMAWAIYLPDGLEACGLKGEAEDLQALIEESDDGSCEATIGHIRKLQQMGITVNSKTVLEPNQ